MILRKIPFLGMKYLHSNIFKLIYTNLNILGNKVGLFTF
mgnify:CR=1 FL=1